MKRLFIAAIVALVIIPGIVLGATPSKDAVVVNGLVEGPVCAAYYNDTARIFYVDSDYKVRYVNVGLSDNDTLVIPWTPGEISKDTLDIEVVSCCCVFQEKLYLFGLSNKIGEEGKCVYIYYDAVTRKWSARQVLPNTKLNSDWPYPGMGVAVLNDKMFLFAVTNGTDYISYASTSDGVKWSYWQPLTLGWSQPLKTSGNIAVCNFMYGETEYLMIVWPGVRNNPEKGSKSHSIRSLWLDEKGVYNYDDLARIGAYADAVALVNGTVEGGGNGNVMQMFYQSKGTTPYYYRNEYYLDKKQWWSGGPGEKLCHDYSINGWPAACSQFLPEGNGLRKQVWMAYSDGLMTSRLHVRRWRSDQFVQIQDSSQTMSADTTLWTLMGVVEGPPPYPLNGVDPTTTITNPANSLLLSELKFSLGTDKSCANSVTTSRSFFVSTGGPGKKFPKKQTDYTRALADKNSQHYKVSVTLTKQIQPYVDTSKFYVEQFYLRPTIRRQKYELRDFNGNNLDKYAYIFSISRFDLVPIVVNMKGKLPYSPSPWNPTSYMNRKVGENSRFRIKCQTSMTCDVLGGCDLSVTTEKGVTSTQSITKTKKTTVGMEGIFNIGIEGSVSFEQEVSTDSIFNVTVSAHPAAARSGHTEDIKSYEFIPYWLEPLDSTAYWIPAGFKDQRPWCITYEVMSVTYNTGSKTAVEEGLAAVLNLDIASLTKAEVTVNYTLPQTAPISLRIYDMSGRLVKTLASGTGEAGEHTISWDACDDLGRTLASGVYFARLDAGEETRLAKVVFVR